MKTGEELPLNILVIDTSTDLEFLALSKDGNIYQLCENAGISHSVTMFQNLSSLFKQASITINDIDLLGAGIGPGSFTGIRIAVSTARMFSQILEIPLVGLKSQEIYAASAAAYGHGTVLVAFDAKKSRIFGGIYTSDDDGMIEILGPGDYHIEDMISSVTNAGELVCIGDGCGIYSDIIKKTTGERGIKCKYLENFSPDGKAAAELTLKKYNESPDKYLDYNCTVPLYTRKSDAEIAKFRK